MDTKIESKNRKIIKIVKLSVLAILLGISISFVALRKKMLKINASEITIKTVEFGTFEDYVYIQAKTEPLQNVLVNIIEGGAIQEIYVENGAKVIKGQPLVKIYNPNSELNYMTQETSIIEQINQLNKAIIEIRNQEYKMEKEAIAVQHEYEEVKNLNATNEKMFQEGILSKNSWEQSQANYQYQLERKKLFQKSNSKEKLNNKNQLLQLNKSLSLLEKNLTSLNHNKKNFIILSPVNGSITSFEPILGKNYLSGESLGKIDTQMGYKLIAEVDEFYLEKLKPNLTGMIEFKGQNLEVSISKIIPEVKNGKFHIELEFKNLKSTMKLSQGINFGIKINISAKKNVVLLPKGQYDNETNGKWVFVVKKNTAEKRLIQVKNENNSSYEVLKGLKPSEKVITSSYKNFKNIDILTIEL